MSATIDERVVEIQFNNRKFEENANETIKTLDKLNSSLDLSGSSKGFTQLQKAVNSVDLNPIEKSLDSIANRVSILGIIGDQVIRNFTSKIVNYGERMVRSFTIDQIAAGFDKYARKTEAIQTIMNATGKSLDDVAVVVEKLNQYTDETSYSFSDMINSIGKFTSAGVDLDVAETAMEGIANWAAKAGVGPEKAAGAFYNLSQAIGSGALKLQDWKSIENLSMGTRDFKEQLMEAGLAAGTLKKQGDKVYTTAGHLEVTVDNLRDSLAKGWVNNDVLLSTLEKYADRTTEFGLQAFHAAQEAKTFKDAIEAVKDAVSTGWMNIFEQIFGDYEEARVLWTNVANELIEVFTSPTQRLAELLTGWHEGGGYIAFVKALTNSWEALKTVVSAVGELFKEFFPGLDSEGLIAFTEYIRDATQAFLDFVKPRETTEFELIDPRLAKKAGLALDDYNDELSGYIENQEQVRDNLQPLKDTFTGVFSILNLIKTVIKGVFTILAPFTKLLGPIAKLIGTIASALGRLTTKIVDTIVNSKAFNDLIERLTSITTIITDILCDAINNLDDFIKTFKETPAVQAFLQVLSDVWEQIKNFISPYLDEAKQKIDDFIGGFSDIDSSDALGLLNTLGDTLAKVATAAIKVAQAIGNYLEPYWGKFVGAMKVAFDWVVEQFDGVWRMLKTFRESDVWSFVIKKLNEVLLKVGELATSLVEYIKEGGLSGLFTWLSEKFWDLIATIRELNLGRVLQDAFSMAKVASIFSFALAIYRIGKAFKTVSGFITDFPRLMKKATKGLAVKRFATSILMLAGALWILSKIPAENIWGLVGVIAALAGILTVFTVAIGAISGFLANKKLFNDKAITKATRGMIRMAIAVLLLAVAMKQLDGLQDPNGALLTLISIMGVLTICLMALSLAGKGIKGLGIGLLLIVAAVILAIFAFEKLKDKFEPLKKALIELTEEDLKKFATILVGVIAVMLGLCLIMKALSKTALTTAALIAAIGIAFFLIAYAVERLMQYEWTDLSKGLVIIAALVGSIYLLSKISKSLDPASADTLKKLGKAMLGLGVAMLLFTAAIWLLGQMDIDQLKQGGIALAQMLLALTVSLAIIGKAKIDKGPIIGMAVLVGVLVLSLWVLTLIDPDKLAYAVISLGGILLALGTSLLIGQAALKKGDPGAMLGVIFIVAILAGSLWVLARQNPENVMTAAIALGAVLVALGVSLFIAQGAFALINWGTLLAVGAMLLLICGGLAILANQPLDGIKAATNSIIEILGTLTLVALAIGVIGKLGGAGTMIQGAAGFVAGVSIVIVGLLALFALLGAIDAVAHDSMVSTLEKASNIMRALGEVLGNFIGGAIEGIAQVLPSVGESISEFFATISAGVMAFSELEIDEGKANGLSALASAILKFTAAELLDGISRLLGGGGTDMAKFADSISELGPAIAKFGESTANVDTTAVQNGADAVSAIAKVANELPREGGLLQKVIGETQSLGSFAFQLQLAVPGIQKFAEAAPDIANKEENIKAAARAIEALVEVGNAIKPSETNAGWGAYTSHTESLGTFCSKLPQIALDLVTFAQNAEPLDDDSISGRVSGVTSLISDLVDLANEIKDAGGGGDINVFGAELLSWDKTGLSSFITKVGEASKDLIGIGTDFGSSELNNLKDFISVILDFISLASNIKNMGSGDSLGGNLLDFADQISRAATKLNEAGGTLAQVDWMAIDKALIEVDSAVSADLSDSGKTMMGEILLGVESYAGEYSSTTGMTIANKLVSGIAEHYSLLTVAGKDSAQGFIDGFISDTMLVAAGSAGSTLGYMTLNSLKAALGIASPSKEFARAGSYSGEGFIKGLKKWIKSASGTGEDMAYSVLDSVYGILDYVQDILNGEIEVDMTIRPVLDVTGVQEGARNINSMLAQTRSLSADLSVSPYEANSEIEELVAVSWKILKAIQNGSDLYLDDKVLAGRINRRLGQI